MSKVLFQALVDHGVDLKEQFDDLERKKKIDKLCTVMGISDPCDPDPTYELTTDNVKKILAIYMRSRCNIPVMIMGETGSGKTRLVEFMCALQNTDAAPIKGNSVKNMIVVKVHGGTTATDIGKAVKKAEEVAKENAKFKNNSFTVLFFDEANTTESIGAIKEVMCDKCIQGKPIQLFEQLKIVAACNPYRKHKEDLIKTLEQAGLGYHVSASKTKDRLGRVPMRRLVYRVQPLPQSMIPLVWDFGQLNTNAELLYIKQMICRYIKEKKLPALNGLDNVLSKLLSDCQNFMRLQQSMVNRSLPDIHPASETLDSQPTSEISDRQPTSETQDSQPTSDVGASLLDILIPQAQSNYVEDQTPHEVHSLQYERECNKCSAYFQTDSTLQICCDICIRSECIERERHASGSNLSKCRDSFLDHVELPPNIARNAALKDNVFLMIVCIELKIPMFLVGKPGSSKSLSKTIVFDNMRGANSREPFFRNLKEIQMVSFQCSPLSRAESIIGTFKKGADLQKNQDANKFVSVVVLDEIGLAEDSETMPLKAS
ncbi:RNF213 [Mytilus coruscus]|uniref:RNF213 n=1 Tax=Mytilus coruscus TaxID=42192 RepID=A0A6J8A9P6_MYTCO|nr:RNF213 [Mytilus coruscus]